MPKRKGNWRTAGPDDPIHKEGLTVYTPLWARPGYQPPKPQQKPADDKEPLEK